MDFFREKERIEREIYSCLSENSSSVSLFLAFPMPRQPQPAALSLSPPSLTHTHTLLAGVWRDGEPLGDPAMPAKTPRGVSGVCAFARIGGEEAKRREREGREELHIMQ